jgi:lipid A ethanolaminephosphotransferase
MLKKKIKLSSFVLIISVINLLLYHFPLYKFAINNLNYKSLGGITILISLAVLIIVLHALIFYTILFISRFIGKFLLVVSAIVNAIAVYFINTYSVIIDKTMIGNILNTRFEESGSFLSFNLIIYFY